MSAATLGVPIHQTSAEVLSAIPSTSSGSTSTAHQPLRAVRSASTFRTPNSSDNDLSADGSHLTNNTSALSLSHHALSLSPPPDLSFSKSSLHSDQEADFLSRPGGGSGVSFNQPYIEHSAAVAAAIEGRSQQSATHSQHDEHVRIASSSRGGGHEVSSYPYHQQNDGSWGSRHSGNHLPPHINNSHSSKNRIRLDSVFGTQLPGFPYLNSAAAATSSALGHPINPHYQHHGSSSSSADLLKGRSSYNWSERSASAASHHLHHSLHTRAPTSNSMRSVHGKESVLSLGRHRPNTPAAAAAGVGAQLPTGDLDTSCSGETGESNSSDEVDLDLSFDMDLLRARQMQQYRARQQRELQQQQQLHQQKQHVGISSSQVQAQREARTRALSSASSLAHSKSGHVGIDMQDSRDNNNNLSDGSSLGLPYHDSEEHRRYLLGGKKRLSRSAVELRPGTSNTLHASLPHPAGSSAGSTPRGPTPSTIRSQQNHPYRHAGALSSTLPSRMGQGGNIAYRRQSKSSHASLDLAVDIPLEDEGMEGRPHPSFIDEDESSAYLGWSFATTPPLSPAEIVTFAEGAGKSDRGGAYQRRYSAGASNLFQSLEKRRSSGDLLQRKRRPSFPLMSLFDKTIRAPVAGIVAAATATTASKSANDGNSPASPHSPDSEPSWGSPTPRESMLLDPTTTMHAHQQQIVHGVPLIPLPSNEQREYDYQNANILDLAETPDSNNDPLPAPPRLHDPAHLYSSPGSSVGTPGTLSPDMHNTNSTFSSPRSPNDDLPTPKTADFVVHPADGNRYSQFSMKAVSDGGMSFASAGSETVEAVHISPSSISASKRESRAFGIGDTSAGLSPNLDSIPEQNDSPSKLNSSTSGSSISSAIGGSPKKTRPPSASYQSTGNNNGGEGIQGQNDVNNSQGHKRQSSSLFRFPFVSSLRNPFSSATRPATPSITTISPNLNDHSPSTSSRDSPSGSVEELLSTSAIAARIEQKKSAASSVKRSNSPNSSEESHFLPSSDPPSPPRPGATSQASKGIDPSMLREGPNTGKGRLSGLGLSFPSTFVNSQPPLLRSTGSETQPTMHRHQPHRQSSLPVLSFSAASDDQHEASGRSVESEEAAIQVVPDENGFGRPIANGANPIAARRSFSDNRQRPFPESAPATTVHFNQLPAGLDSQVAHMHNEEFGASDRRSTALESRHEINRQHRRPRARLISAQGLDLRGRIDRMRPSQLLFLAAFIAGPWCFILGGWCLRSIDGDYRSAKGIRCRCPGASETCECQAEIYKQIKLSGGQVERVLQSQNGEVRKMDRFVLANRVGALTCGTGTLVLAITALIVVGRAW